MKARRHRKRSAIREETRRGQLNAGSIQNKALTHSVYGISTRCPHDCGRAITLRRYINSSRLYFVYALGILAHPPRAKGNDHGPGRRSTKLSQGRERIGKERKS